MMGPVCMSLTLPLLLGAAQDELPEKHESKDGRYTVEMPNKTRADKQTVGKLTVFVAIADGPSDSAFVVSYCDYAAAELKKGAEDKRLEQACKGAVERSRGELRGEAKAIKLAGKYPGREIVIEKKGEIIAKMRIYLVDNRLYQVMVLGNGPFFSRKDKDVGNFLDSFRLNK
jgi:hypothetical protein